MKIPGPSPLVGDLPGGVAHAARDRPRDRERPDDPLVDGRRQRGGPAPPAETGHVDPCVVEVCQRVVCCQHHRFHKVAHRVVAFLLPLVEPPVVGQARVRAAGAQIDACRWTWQWSWRLWQ